MKRILKVVGYVLAVTALLAVAFLGYHFREQEIDVGLIPNKFSYCAHEIYGSNIHYQEITNWLKKNKAGWNISYASYVAGIEYRSPAFNISVHPNFVVVWYKTDEGYPQFVRSIKHQLPMECQ